MFFAAVLFAVGLFSITCAVMNWDWYMNSRRARLFVSIFGRTGARIFYVLLGLAMCVIAALSATDGGF